MIDKIAKKLRKASDAYYNTGKTIMSDSDFDKLRDHLKKIDPDHEFFSEVGAKVPKHREEVKLLMHMGSQNKAKDDSDMKTWYEKYKSPEIIISDKLDGSSIELVYEDGKLARAATRGDGTTGMAVTKNAKLWSGVPESIDVSGQLIVRGEVQLSVANWKKYFPEAPNPRNMGNGIAVSDSEYKRNEYLDFHAFDIVHPEVTFKKQEHKFKALKALGFNSIRWFRCKNWEEVEKCRAHYVEDRSDLDYEIDGMIGAINDLEVQEKLGYSDGGTRPRGMIAWKFDTEKAETKVTGMVITIGHTGRIIPKATLEPVKLAGTTVSNCLLNNFDYIQNLNLNIGDVVEVEKGGDIIPHINSVVKKNSKGCYPAPTHWESKDGSKWPLVKEGAYLLVTDEDCPELGFKRIKNWVNKTNIKQLGDTALLAMMDAGLVKDIDDLYTLDENKVSALPVGNGIIGSNAKKILSEIDKTREMTVDLFIGSLSIKHLGRSRAALLEIDDVDGYLKLTAKSLAGKKCSDTGTYGEDVAKEIHESLEQRTDLIKRLCKHVKIKKPKKAVSDGPLSGKTFCFTGVRATQDQKDLMMSLGGEEKKSVSKGLTYLVAKDPSATSSKLEKARKLGTEVIGLDDFEKLLK